MCGLHPRIKRHSCTFGRRLAKKTIVFVKKLKRLLLAIPPKVRSHNAAHLLTKLH